jgi:hypothetical protein
MQALLVQSAELAGEKDVQEICYVVARDCQGKEEKENSQVRKKACFSFPVSEAELLAL